VTDTSNDVVKRFNILSGALTGWTGYVLNTPTGGAAGCTSATTDTGQFCLGGASQHNSTPGAFAGPTSIAILGSTGYVADQANSRIQRVDLDTGTVTGWIGKITGTAPNAGFAGCTATTNAVTPGWCVGGSSGVGADDGMLYHVRGVTTDGTKLYAVDQNHRIQAYDLASGTFIGWLGKIVTVPTGPGAPCTSAVAGDFTPGWCTGGTNKGDASGEKGGLTSPSSIVYSSGYLYVLSSGRVSKFDATTGAFVGWIGKIMSATGLGGAAGCSAASVGQATPGWCTGGAPAGASPIDGTFSVDAIQIAASGTAIYVTDQQTHKIMKFDAASGAYLGWKGNVLTVPTSGAAGCTSVSVGNFTPGWCFGGSAGPTQQIGFDAPQGIAVDSNYLYITDSNNNRLLRIPGP